MVNLYSLFLCLFLALVVLQDFRYRGLSVFIIASSAVLSVLYSFSVNGWKQALIMAGINLSLVFIQVVGVTAYFSFKKKAFTNILNAYLGAGDLLFFVILAFTFSPFNFVLFCLFSSLIILIVYGISGYSLQSRKPIPLAGWMAMFRIGVVAAGLFWSGMDPYNDYVINF